MSRKMRQTCLPRNSIREHASMESTVEKLVDDFEGGRLSRRDLVKALTAIAAAGTATTAKAQETPFVSTAIDHISVQVEALAPSIEFYQTILDRKSTRLN